MQLVNHKEFPEVSCVYEMRHNISGRKYIGRTVNLKERMRRHHSDMVSGYKTNSKIERTVKKYGIDFLVKILVVGDQEYCGDIEGKLLSEINLRESLNCHRNSTGGSIGLIWSDESRKKLSDAKKGYVVSEQAKKNMRIANKASKLCKEHVKKLHSKEIRKKALLAAAEPKIRAKAVATRMANGHKPFSDECRQKQRGKAKAKVFAMLDWAVKNKQTRGAAIKKFGASWGSLKAYLPEWESLNGKLPLPQRASGEKSGMYKHGLSKEIKRRRTASELAKSKIEQSERMSGERNPNYKHGRYAVA